MGGTLDAPRAQWMPYAQFPVTIQISKIAITAEVTAGVVKYTGSRPLASQYHADHPTPSYWTPIIDTSLRVNF